MEYRDFLEQVKEQIQDGAELDDVLAQIASVYQILMDKIGEGTATIIITDNLMDGYGIKIGRAHV